MTTYTVNPNKNGPEFEFVGENLQDAIRKDFKHLMTHGSRYILGNFKLIEVSLFAGSRETVEGGVWRGVVLECTYRGYDLDPSDLEEKQATYTEINCPKEDLPDGILYLPREGLL